MVSKNKMLTAFLLGGVFGSMFTVASFFHSNEAKEELLSYSEGDWIAFEVESKLIQEVNSNTLEYSLDIDSKGQFDLHNIDVDKELFTSVEEGDVIRILIEGNKIEDVEVYELD